MARLALLVSLIALVIAVLAYKEAAGTRTLQEGIRSLQSAVDVARKETADALGRLEQTLRSADQDAGKPAKPKP